MDFSVLGQSLASKIEGNHENHHREKRGRGWTWRRETAAIIFENIEERKKMLCARYSFTVLHALPCFLYIARISIVSLFSLIPQLSPVIVLLSVVLFSVV